LEGSIVNQIELSGFDTEKESEKFRKKLKSLKSIFNLSKINKSLSFIAEDASWKVKEDFSLVYLFLTEDTYPEKEIQALAGFYNELNIQHLVISPSGAGRIIHYDYTSGVLTGKIEQDGSIAHMLGDLIHGGFQ
jgi:hypothetical protein